MLKAGWIFTFTVVLISCSLSEHQREELTPADNSIENQYISGQRIYNEGILPTGEPMQTSVLDDIPADGRMFSCENCHRRSGLGSTESYVVVPPVNGASLFRPRKVWDPWRRHSNKKSVGRGSRPVPSFFLGKDLRPEYTEETLARVIRTGIDPSGRELDYIMPRYSLNDRDMTLLVNYMKGLSRELSPGVTEDTLRFATVVTEGVSPVNREAMLSVLKAYIRDRNVQTRNQGKRSRKGAFIKRELDAAYRLLTLDVWELKGPGETWGSQLEYYYRKEPVFAVLGGIAAGDWAPIHEFCEQNKIPCIFPVTDQPVISLKDRNTMYFSKGLYQEGEAAARYLRRIRAVDNDTRLVQVFRAGSRGSVIAGGFQESWGKFALSAPEDRTLSADETITDYFLKGLTSPKGKTIILLWTGKRDINAINRLQESPHRPTMVFVSSGLLEESVYAIPSRGRDFVYITYPYSLPHDKKRNIAALKMWLKIKKIKATNLRIQSKMYFLGWMLAEALARIKSEFYRDYFLEMFEMMIDQSHAIAVYPRLSFSTGQRYASKGCYVVQLSKDRKPSLIKKSGWVVH